MAYADSTKSHATAHGLAGLAPALANLTERFAKYRMFRRTYAELAELSPREMEDLGLSSYNLRAAAHEAVYGKR